ncbi:MAG TPA: hypothetical protein DDW65_20435 [Firmicutes bacterium]|jgi:hypothetical protein|nr:hypothetical protein [Bacillota bacterium]
MGSDAVLQISLEIKPFGYNVFGMLNQHYPPLSLYGTFQYLGYAQETGENHNRNALKTFFGKLV